MSLILRNKEFLKRSLEDTDAFGWPFTLTNPLGESQTITGQARHINMLIDMETGADVQQEQLSVVAVLSTITIGEPKKNWLVKVTDTAGNEYDCYVVLATPDRTFDTITLKLGLLETP